MFWDGVYFDSLEKYLVMRILYVKREEWMGFATCIYAPGMAAVYLLLMVTIVTVWVEYWKFN